ncbi:MAG: DUF1223 domain-containing protein [Bryobacteraceae bacterium]|nr:DUF1223 domain-containing protein [Bryobacteraceae bacterium]
MMTRRALLAGLAGTAQKRRPVLVELFTSQGCSSCPPADRLLERLDREQPVAGADILVLSEHVDYWNHIGWTDPFSSPLYSERQQRYARQFRLDSVYTPQMVVDGITQFVGSDQNRAEAAIRSAAEAPKKSVTAVLHGSRLSVKVDGREAGEKVWVAAARESGSSDVVRGENRGRRLVHVAVAERLMEVGGGGEVELGRSRWDGYQLLVFAQARSGRVTGAARVYRSW